MPAGQKIRIAIADDHAVLCEALAALLGSEDDFEVVGSAADGYQALELVQRLDPDVLLLDLFMPNRDGFEVLRQIDRTGFRVASLILTGSQSQADFVQVVRLGAHGLVLKSDSSEKLFTAIRTVARGELAFGDEVAQGIITAMVSEAHVEPATNLERLSERERQIAGLVARGLKNKDIGHELGISENTVKRHLQSIFSKTGTKDRLELAVLALSDLRRAA